MCALIVERSSTASPLLATGAFAPVSITRLGGAFLAGGLVLLVLSRLGVVR